MPTSKTPRVAPLVAKFESAMKQFVADNEHFRTPIRKSLSAARAARLSRAPFAVGVVTWDAASGSLDVVFGIDREFSEDDPEEPIVTLAARCVEHARGKVAELANAAVRIAYAH